MRVALALIFCATSPGAVTTSQQRQRDVAAKATVSRGVRAALERINADSLRGHLSFIASDLLEGRNTPSRGLDLAAEYIAAQFRRAGLEPAGKNGDGNEYFQTTEFALRGSPESPVRSQNVAALLRGSDPVLKETYVILSAHYDHIGLSEQATADDKIFNGANDDGSGTVALIEVASALAQMNPRPKRSILFIAFTGEEKGLLGSRYYGKHPLVPLARTVAQINLEHLGRTDDIEGPQVGTVAVTGFDYSTIGATLKQAGDALGIKVYRHPTKSDSFFRRSDNQSLADLGIPAHTLSVAFEFPDYHGAGDHWEKIDYANMQRITRLVALGLHLIANDVKEPLWSEQNPKTRRFVEAWNARRAKP